MFIYPFDKKNFEIILFYNENMPNILNKQSSVSSPFNPSQVSTADRQALLNSNPYANAQYKESPWQQFLTSLGFRTGADAWRENMFVQAAEYEAQMMQKQYDEEYNSPINQVARLRAAGINPDLEGGASVSAGEAASPAQDPSTPMQSQGDEGKLLDFAQGIMGCVSTAVGIAGSIENLRGIQLDNVLKSISGEEGMTKFAEQMFPYFLPESPEGEIYEDGSARSWQSLALERAQMFAGHLPKKMQSRFLDNVQTFWNSAPGTAEAYKQWRNRVSEGKGYSVDSRTNFSWDSGEMEIIADELSRLASKVEKQGLRSEGAESEYNADYYENLSGEASANAENSENNLRQQNAEMTGALRESLNNIVQRIKESKNKDGHQTIASQVLLAVLGMFQLYIASSGMPSVTRSSTSSVNGNTGVYSEKKSYVLDF